MSGWYRGVRSRRMSAACPVLSLGAAVILALAASAASVRRRSPRRRRPRYPAPPRADHEDDYHGTKVSDPFRPLEDPDAPDVRTWVAAENRLTERFLSRV